MIYFQFYMLIFLLFLNTCGIVVSNMKDYWSFNVNYCVPCKVELCWVGPKTIGILSWVRGQKISNKYKKENSYIWFIASIDQIKKISI